MPFVPASAGSLVAFLAIVVGVVAAVVAGVYVASRRLGVPAGRRAAGVAVGIGMWVGIVAAVVRSGWVAGAPMPRLMMFFVAINLVALGFALSPVGGWLGRGVPVGALIAFQGFRLPLELVLHDWARRGTIPESMTWTGSNFDIVTGVLALLAAPFAGRSRAVAWGFNVVGFALLVNVIRVAVLSSPLPFAWPVRPPLLLAFHLPYALIAPVCVGGALAGHVVLARALLSRRGGESLPRGSAVQSD